MFRTSAVPVFRDPAYVGLPHQVPHFGCFHLFENFIDRRHWVDQFDSCLSQPLWEIVAFAFLPVFDAVHDFDLVKIWRS